MRKFLPLFALLFAINLSFGQKQISIQINHILDGEVFENNKNVQNDLDNDFMIDRLQYYISTFSIVHDGGQVTELEDLYVLVSTMDSSEPTIIDLGTHSIESLESVNFHFGIDYDSNHADPSLWPSGHALAPANPSMHWGWAAGYRFIALEGKAGPLLDQTIEFHAIGDEFYEEMNFPVDMDQEGDYLVQLDAEYRNLLSQLDVSDGIILHGGGGKIGLLTNNLKQNVFTIATVTSADDVAVTDFNVYPNPAPNGLLQIESDVLTSNYTISISDVLGRNVQSINGNGNQSIEIEEAGLYFISLIAANGATLATRKVIVQ